MKFHDTLNEKIWDLTTEDLIPEVKEKLEEIAEAFIEFLEIPTDAVLDKVITGSSASYNYNEFSDLDLHIIVDYDKVHEDCPLVNGYLNSLKKQFNDNHDITIHGVPVELYAEQKDQGTVHNGLYSLQTGWIDKPQKIAPTDNDAAVEAKYNEIKELVDKCDDSEEATELLDKIYTMRKAGLAEAGEFCTENLAFKKLRNEGCMDKLRQIKKEQIDKQLSLESYNESNTNLKEQIKQLFPWIYSTTVYNIGEVFDDRGIINLNFEIEGGRSDNEIFIWVFQDNLEIWYTNGGRGGRSHVGSIKIDDITKDNFIASVMDLLKLAKSTIEEFYKKEEKRQKEKYSKTRTYDIEDDEKELYAFISKTFKSIKKQLNKEFSIHQTDNTIYINYDKKPENTVFVEPVEDSTQILKIGLLDDNNDEIDYRELDLEDFGKTDINNIINTIKELFMDKNESIKESKGYNEALQVGEAEILEWLKQRQVKVGHGFNKLSKEGTAYYMAKLINSLDENIINKIKEADFSNFNTKEFTLENKEALEAPKVVPCNSTITHLVCLYINPETNKTYNEKPTEEETLRRSIKIKMNKLYNKKTGWDRKGYYFLQKNGNKYEIVTNLGKGQHEVVISADSLQELNDILAEKLNKGQNNSKNESIKEDHTFIDEYEVSETRGDWIITKDFNYNFASYVAAISNKYDLKVYLSYYDHELIKDYKGEETYNDIKWDDDEVPNLLSVEDALYYIGLPNSFPTEEFKKAVVDINDDIKANYDAYWDTYHERHGLPKPNKNECLNKLEETLKKVEDMEINEGMWASPFTMENAKQVAELLSKPITYEELNSEEGKQKVWNIIGDDEFWDNVADEALDNPEEDARYLIVKFLEDWMERKESFNDDTYSQEAENIIKKAIFMFNGITEDMATLEKKVDTADNDLHDIITSLENTMSEALKE